LKLLQERLIIETTNLELQKEMLDSEKNSYDCQNSIEMDELNKMKALYKKMLKESIKSRKDEKNGSGN